MNQTIDDASKKIEEIETEFFQPQKVVLDLTYDGSYMKDDVLRVNFALFSRILHPKDTVVIQLGPDKKMLIAIDFELEGFSKSKNDEYKLAKFIIEF